jgi:hypothetical protein
MLHFGIVRPDERGLITNPLGLAAVRLTTTRKVPWIISLLVLMGRRECRVSGTLLAESGFQIALRYGFAADEPWALGLLACARILV